MMDLVQLSEYLLLHPGARHVPDQVASPSRPVGLRQGRQYARLVFRRHQSWQPASFLLRTMVSLTRTTIMFKYQTVHLKCHDNILKQNRMATKKRPLSIETKRTALCFLWSSLPATQPSIAQSLLAMQSRYCGRTKANYWKASDNTDITKAQVWHSKVLPVGLFKDPTHLVLPKCLHEVLIRPISPSVSALVSHCTSTPCRRPV